MNRLTDKERKALMNDMRSFDVQMPCVGTFWYDAGTQAIVTNRPQAFHSLNNNAYHKKTIIIEI